MVSKQTQKYKLLAVLSCHIGRQNAISMAELHKAVFGGEVRDKIQDTRKIRHLITQLRKEGVPICSCTKKEESGYYLASAGSEMEDYCRRIRRRALRLLAMESKLRKLALPKLLNEIQLTLLGDRDGSN